MDALHRRLVQHAVGSCSCRSRCTSPGRSATRASPVPPCAGQEAEIAGQPDRPERRIPSCTNWRRSILGLASDITILNQRRRSVGRIRNPSQSRTDYKSVLTGNGGTGTVAGQVALCDRATPAARRSQTLHRSPPARGIPWRSSRRQNRKPAHGRISCRGHASRHAGSDESRPAVSSQQLSLSIARSTSPPQLAFLQNHSRRSRPLRLFLPLEHPHLPRRRIQHQDSARGCRRPRSGPATAGRRDPSRAVMVGENVSGPATTPNNFPSASQTFTRGSPFSAVTTRPLGSRATWAGLQQRKPLDPRARLAPVALRHALRSVPLDAEAAGIGDPQVAVRRHRHVEIGARHDEAEMSLAVSRRPISPRRLPEASSDRPAGSPRRPRRHRAGPWRSRSIPPGPPGFPKRPVACRPDRRPRRASSSPRTRGRDPCRGPAAAKHRGSPSRAIADRLVPAASNNRHLPIARHVDAVFRPDGHGPGLLEAHGNGCGFAVLDPGGIDLCEFRQVIAEGVGQAAGARAESAPRAPSRPPQ